MMSKVGNHRREKQPRHLRRIFVSAMVVFLAVLISLSSASPLLAAIKWNDTPDIKERASRLQDIEALKACVVDPAGIPAVGIETNITKIREGKVIYRANGTGLAHVYIWDPTIEAAHSSLKEDNDMSCTENDMEFVRGAISRLKLDPVQLVCDLGIPLENGLTGSACYKNTTSNFKGAGFGKHWTVNGVTFDNAIKKQITDLPSLYSDTSMKAAWYMKDRHILERGCLGDKISYSDWQGIQDGNQRYNIHNYPDNQPPTENADSKKQLYYTARSNKNQKPRAYENGAGTNSSPEKGPTNCETYWNGVRDRYQDYMAYKDTLSQEDQDALDESEQDNVTPTDVDEGSSCVIDGIGWLVCPVVNFMAGVADAAFNFLADQFLSVDTKLFGSGTPTFAAWQNFLRFGNIALVIGFLFIIFSQLSSVGISNYGIKKLLPKIIIVAILMNLSYIICQLAVDVSNILGYSLKNVLGGMTPTPPTGGSDVGGFAGMALGILAGTGVAAGAVLATGGIMLALIALIATLLSAVIALVMIFFILVLREVLIVLLIVIAPLAFAAFLLPNTEQWFTKWRKTFTSLLMVFPVIGVVFGASTLASVIISASYNGTGGTDNWLGQIVAALAMILPLFIVPGLLRKSIDAAGALGGKLSGMGAKLGGKASAGVKGSKFAKHQQGLADIRRAQTAAGTYKGSKLSPRRWRSGINKRLNNADWYNAATGGYGAKLASRGAGIEDDLFEKDVKEAALTQNEFSMNQRKDLATAKEGSMVTINGKQVRATKEQITAARDHVMSSGGFSDRRAMLEHVAASGDQSAKARTVQQAFSKGDANIYGKDFGDNILDNKIKDGAGLMDNAIQNAAKGNLQAEHLVQSGSATKWLGEEIANRTAAGDATATTAAHHFTDAASAARTSESTKSKIDGDIDNTFKSKYGV